MHHGATYRDQGDALVAGIEESRRRGKLKTEWCVQCDGYHLIKATKDELEVPRETTPLTKQRRYERRNFKRRNKQ